MGEYHYIVNTRKRQYLDPNRFQDGLKLREFGSSGCGTMLGLAVLLADSGEPYGPEPIVGSWAGDPIVITGDYSNKMEHVPPEDVLLYRVSLAWDKTTVKALKDKGLKPQDVEPNLYTVASQCYEDVSDTVIAALCSRPYERKALIERGAEAAKNWQPPAQADPFSLE